MERFLNAIHLRKPARSAGVIFLLFFFSCGAPKKTLPEKTTTTDTVKNEIPQTEHGYEAAMQKAGLVNVQDLDPTIRVDMKYSTDDNFLGFDVYGSLDKCYLQPDVADKLVKANRYLKEENPLYTLLVYDGARPRSIQRKMWDTVKTMPVKQGTYVSNPNKGSLHNFGAAVDLTVADENGNALDMGTPYDFFGDRAHTDIEARLLSTGEITEEQLANRKLLRRVMNKAGFFGIQSEWWHFNSCTRDAAAQKYTIIE